MGVLGQLVAYQLTQVGSPIAEFWHAIDDVHDQVEAVAPDS
jgi:hypothetical protein